MTSNLGSDLIQSMADKSHETICSAVMAVVDNYFRPEFINRIDETVVFHALNRQHIEKILDIQMGRLAQRLNELNYGIQIDGAVSDKLCESGFDSVYGARPLRRAIQNLLENPLAEVLLKGEFDVGETINVRLSNTQSIEFVSSINMT